MGLSRLVLYKILICDFFNVPEMNLIILHFYNKQLIILQKKSALCIAFKLRGRNKEEKLVSVAPFVQALIHPHSRQSGRQATGRNPAALQFLLMQQCCKSLNLSQPASAISAAPASHWPTGRRTGVPIGRRELRAWDTNKQSEVQNCVLHGIHSKGMFYFVGMLSTVCQENSFEPIDGSFIPALGSHDTWLHTIQSTEVT